MVFPDPNPLPMRRCRRCGHATRLDKMIEGYGIECATLLGLTTATPRVRAGEQTGESLFDLLPEPEPEDECDGWDRPADRP